MDTAYFVKYLRDLFNESHMVKDGKFHIRFKDLENKPVHSSDKVLLGRIFSLNYDHIVVKKEDNNETFFRFPLGVFDTWDGYSLWLNITEEESIKQYIMEVADKIDYNTKTPYETVTFRLNENPMRFIRSGANERSVSVNNFVNSVLRRYVEADKFGSMTGMIYISKPVVTEIFNSRTEKEIVNLAKFTAKDAIYNTVLFSQGEGSLEAFLLWLEKEMNKHSFNVRHVTGKNKSTYIIRHEVCYKFSLYYKTIISEMFQDQFKRHVDFTISDELLLFEFEHDQ